MALIWRVADQVWLRSLACLEMSIMRSRLSPLVLDSITSSEPPEAAMVKVETMMSSISVTMR
jgi:hypothetical protein